VFIARDTLSSEFAAPGSTPSGQPSVATIGGSPSISTRQGGSSWFSRQPGPRPSTAVCSLVMVRNSRSPAEATKVHCAPATVPASTSSPDPGSTTSFSASAMRLPASTRSVHSTPSPAATMFADCRMAQTQPLSTAACCSSSPGGTPMPSPVWICTAEG
jgi:hypothetical protein